MNTNPSPIERVQHAAGAPPAGEVTEEMVAEDNQRPFRHGLATDQIWHLMKEVVFCANLHDVSVVVNAIRHTRELAYYPGETEPMSDEDVRRVADAAVAERGS